MRNDNLTILNNKGLGVRGANLPDNYSPIIGSSGLSLMVIFLFVVFFLSTVHSNINPVDMFFGDGAGNGGIFNMLSDFGTNTLDFMYKTSEIYKSWGIIDSPSDWINLLGQVLNVSTFLINLIIQLVMLIFRLLMFILTGGAVSL